MSVAEKLGLGPTREMIKVHGGWIVRIKAHAMFNPEQRLAEVRLTDAQLAGYDTWRAGKALIQDALPDLSAKDRDRLMGIY